MNNTTPTINPAAAAAADPNGQLNQPGTGYNNNGSNQPIAGNIANELEVNYRTRGGTMSRELLTPKIELFLLDHFQRNDINSYNKVMNGVNTANGEKPKWWNISNTIALRNGLRNLP